MSLVSFIPRRLLAVPAALLVIIAAAAPAAAAGPTMTRVASGLDQPRGVAIGPNGAVYVAEAGSAGTDCREPAPGAGQFCVGATGAVTRIWKGHQAQILTGLPSLATPPEQPGSPPDIVGPAGIDVLGNGNLEVSIGGTSGGLFTGNPTATWLGWLLKATPGGTWKPLANVGAYEYAHNPDGAQIDTDPFGVAAVPGGAAVADAAGNDLLWTDRAGHVSLLAVFPTNRTAPLPFPPFVDVPFESVPTAVTRGPDGAFYVGELTGFPFPAGRANVYRVVPGQAPTVYATGFTNIMDISFAPNGTLYVAEISATGLLNGPIGAVMSIPWGGGSSPSVVAGGLFAPGGIATAKDGSVYVSTCAVCPHGGEVWHIQP